MNVFYFLVVLIMPISSSSARLSISNFFCGIIVCWRKPQYITSKHDSEERSEKSQIQEYRITRSTLGPIVLVFSISVANPWCAEPRSRHEKLRGLEQVYQNRSGGCPVGVFWQESCHSFNVLYLELVERPLDARSASSFACGEIGIDEDETLSLPFDAVP